MKKILYTLLVAVVATALSSCDKEPLRVPYKIGDWQFCLPAKPFQGYEVYTEVINKNDIVAALQSAGVEFDADRIESAKFESATVEVEASGSNLNEIQSLEVYIGDVGQTTNLTQIAYSENIGDNATSTTLRLNGTELKSFILKDQFQLTLKALNKDKTSTGGTAAICLKLTEGVINMQVKQ